MSIYGLGSVRPLDCPVRMQRLSCHDSCATSLAYLDGVLALTCAWGLHLSGSMWSCLRHYKNSDSISDTPTAHVRHASHHSEQQSGRRHSQLI